MLRVRLLGELQAEADGVPVVPPPGRRAWSLLGWLALHPGEHARGSVAARFWPDVLDSSARASLRSALWELRRALGEGDALHAGRDRIALRCETDLARFEAHCAAGELEHAIALNRGPLLADLDDDWVLDARDEHAERLAAALARLAASAPDPAQAVAWARRRLALDPLDEEAARDLMRRLADAGDRPGALAVYDRLSDRLREALGLAPSQPTRALAGEVREGPAPTATHSEEVALVGRDAQLTELGELWAGVRAGAGAVAVISGEGGIGKTRLAGELVARARTDLARAARCTAVDLGGAPPFGPWAELLAGLAPELDPPGPEESWPEELARLAPSLPRRLGRPRAALQEAPPELARARMFEAAVELAEHAAAERPLVLVFDDVHLADVATLELAAYLARRIERLPVLLVLTRRPLPRSEGVDALLHAARGRGVAVRELELQPLERAHVEALVAFLEPPARARVIAAADGNPLLALESARAAARGDTGPPASLRGAVRAALAPLAEPARHAAEVAAVAGRDLDRGELSVLAEPDAVSAATGTGLFRSADGRFGFRHALLREAVAADLDETRRAALHETLGHALAASPAEAARHLRLAGRDDLAATRLVEAAEAAIRATALHEAVAYLTEATELVDDSAPRLRLAETLAVLGRREPALAALQAALDRTHPADHARRAAAYAESARWFRSSLCDPAGARRASEAALAALDAGRIPDPELRVELLLVRAWSEVTTGAGDAEATLAGIDIGDAPLSVHHRDTVRGFALLAQGRMAEAEEVLVRSGETGVMMDRPDLAYSGWANAACVAIATGAFERALGYAERGSERTDAAPIIGIQMAALRAYVLSRLGRHDEAREATDRQAELASRTGLPEFVALADHDAGLLAIEAGDFERAERLLGRALAGDPPVQRGEARLRRAEALARLGRAAEADAEIRAATQELVRPSHRPAVLLARMTFAQALNARARGDHERAAKLLADSERHWRLIAAKADAARDHLASLVDLGRPPITGVVDPARELDRVRQEELLADLR
jgi:DNA-binding SARP family transcriptional activator